MPLVRIRDIANDDTEVYFEGEYSPKDVVVSGDFLVGMDGDFNLRDWKGPQALLNQRVMRLRNWQEVESQFMRIPLQMILDYLHARTSQTTVKHLSAKQVNGIWLPIPPLDEQARIVARVAELAALTAALDASLVQGEAARDAFTRATCRRVETATTRGDVTENFRDLAGSVDALTTRARQVESIRDVVRSLALYGRLALPEPRDEPIERLLERVDHERERLFAAGERRVMKQPLALLDPERAWLIPEHWQFRALGDLALFIDYRGQTPTKVPSGMRLVTAKNVRPGIIAAEPREFISESTYATWMTRGIPECGDVLFTTEAPLGYAAVVDMHEKFALAQRVICFRLFGGIDSDFVALQIASRPFRAVLEAAATGLTAKGIKAAKLKRLPFAVPPLEEQRRIVDRMRAYMTLLDQLETSLGHAEALRAALRDAALSPASVNHDAAIRAA